MIRRISLPFKIKRPILSCGADMKGAFAFARGREAFLAEGFGDMANPDNFTRYEDAVKKCQKELGIKPQIIAHDLHPGYFSNRFAENYSESGALYPVQHHEAHIASAIADNDIKGDVVGVAFDGTGYGSDGNIWGGEFFVGSLKGFTRAAHFEYIPMPGGEKAIRQPWRMAVSYMYHAFGNRLPVSARRWRRDELAVLKTMIDKGINSPFTSSAGRLFDAVGNIILEKDVITKDAQLPVELERLVSGQSSGSYEFDIKDKGGMLIIGTAPVIKGVIKDLRKNRKGKKGKAVIACKFHNAMADIVTKVSLKLSRKLKTGRVVLSGGVFRNKYLTARASGLLSSAGLKVYVNSQVSTDDSGIPLGQIAIANERPICV
ncbi:MAG: hypothetical protein PHS46_06555 [Candidatus Omnitrophica bacterium]|nr:hypothetical protein [Candidatus Omnitrophota bacterium]